MTTEEFLTYARDCIDQQGWTQGRYTNGDGAFCARGALYEAAFFMEYHGDGYDLSEKARGQLVASEHYLIKVLDQEYSWFSGLVKWNDHHSRTKQEVLDAFDKALELVGSD